jgi:hypothetical protein
MRRTDPLRATAETAPRLSFESAGVTPLGDYERRHIGYRLVRLLDSPDELRSREIGILDQGDEVQLLQRHGVYWLVLCPDGRQGWVHRMTLADPASAAAIAIDPDPMPQYPIEDEMPEGIQYADDVSGDGLLEAYMSARRDVLRNLADEWVEGSTDSPPAIEFQSATFAATVFEEPVPAEPIAAEFAAAAEPIVEAPAAASPEPVEEPASPASPAAGPARAGERYSARKTAGTRKAASASRPGTKSRRPSR